MSKYDRQYHIAFPRYHEDDCILLKADKATHRSGYTEERLRPGKPLIFTNANAEDFGTGGQPEKLTDVLFRGPDMMVRSWFKEFLAQFNIDDLQLYPALYIDTQDKYHDGYWFLNIYDELDCWDRNDSEFRLLDPDDEDDEPTVVRYALNAHVLDRIPEEQRLIFRMGGTDLPLVFIHDKIRQFLEDRSATGIRLFKVTDYVKGMDVRP